MSSKLDAIFERYSEVMSASDAAELLGMTKQAIYGWLREGIIPGYKVANTWFVLRDDLKDVLEHGANRAAAQSGHPDVKESDDEH